MRGSEIVARKIPPTSALGAVFSFSLAVSLGLWSYAVFTTAIDSLEFKLFPMFWKMPPTFWVGWGFLVLSTIAWYISPTARRLHPLLALSWTLFLFVGPELMEVNARGNDTFGHLLGVTFYDEGRYRYPEVSYSAFPGFHFLAIPLYKVTGVEYLQLAKLLALVLHIIRLAGIWYLGSCLLKEKKAALFFALLLLALLWDNQQLDPSNQNMGLTFVFFFLAVLLAPGTAGWERRLLAMIFFTATVMTHPLSAIVLISFLSFFLLMGLSGRSLGYEQATRRSTFLLFAVAVFTVWVFYIGDWVLPTGLEKMTTFLGEEGDALTLKVREANQRVYALLVYSLLGLLLVWGLAIVLRKDFRARLSLRRVLPALCILPPLPAFALGVWTIERYYLMATPVIAWFLAQERATRKYLALFFLIILLGYTFSLRYYGEYVDYNPTDDFHVARFVATKIPLSATVYRGHGASPTFANLSNVLDTPEWVDSGEVLSYDLKPGVDFQFALDSEREKNIVIFRSGEELWEVVKEVLAAPEAGCIYSSGGTTIRAY